MLDYDVAGLGRLCLAWDQPSYRARQIIKWVHREGCSDPMLMTDLPKAFRQKLAEEAAVVVPSILKDQTAQDGTRKWLLGLSDGNAVETVFIPEERRGTLCVSSQVGCMLQCDFCATGKQGFNRNLSLAEIIGQLWLAVRLLSREQGRHDHQITNVVMMGMGEPLLNVEAVVPAMNLMLSDDAYGLSKRRVTLSTSGIVPEMMSLYARSPVALAVSLHAANNALRDQLVPINRKYPLEQLIPLCRHYFDAEPRRRVMFEYVMLEGVNDTDRDLRDLGKLLSGVRCKINLIPFNTFQGTVYRSSSMSRIRVFRERLDAMGFHTTIRKTRGDDRQSACGQLTAEGAFLDKTRRRLRFEALTIERGVP